MAKAKKNTFPLLMEALGAPNDVKDVISIGNGDRQLTITVKKKLTIAERAGLVNSIVAMVWGQDEEGNKTFAPYLRKFACDYNIITYFTDITLPADMNKVWALIDGTAIVDTIIAHVGGDYIDKILREANELIEYRKAETLRHSKLDVILDSVGEILKVVREKTDGMDINELLEAIQKSAPEVELEKLVKAQASAMPESAPITAATE